MAQRYPIGRGNREIEIKKADLLPSFAILAGEYFLGKNHMSTKGLSFRKSLVLICAAVCGASTGANAADQTGINHPDHTSAEWQIAAYGSAAPAYIGKFATVIGGSGEVIRKGSNGWTCLSLNPRPFPENGWKDAHDAMPGCGDEEGMKWMQAALAGTKPDILRDTFIWMLHGDVGEDNTKMGVLDKADSTPGEWIESGAHLMLMPKDPASLEALSDDFTTGAPYVMMPGSDYAHLMIPLVGYYDYQPESSPAN